MKRVMCVYLPRWPMQRLKRLRRELLDKPAAIVRPHGTKGAQVLLCCPRAAQAGVRPGMTVAEAKGVALHLALHEEDAAGDVQALRQLAAWGERFSPIVGLEEGPAPESLFFDITGCASCFHGEDRLGKQALQELAERGWRARIALADTCGAAWGLAHFMKGSRDLHDSGNLVVVPPGAAASAVLPLPLAALRLPAETLGMLASLGLERIGELAELPRNGITHRFGVQVLQRLDQALGAMAELIHPVHSLPEVEAGCSLEYPIERRQALNHVVEHLLARIEEMLRQRHAGGRYLECWLYHETAAPLRIEVRLFRPDRSARHLGELLATQLERAVLAEPVNALLLRVPVVEPIVEHQFDLFDGDGSPSVEALPLLIDRLASRLGRDAVTFATLLPDPQPEYACRYDSAVVSPGVASPGATSPGATGSGRGGLKATRGKTARSPVLGGDFPVPGERPVQLLPAPLALDVVAVAPEGPPSRLRRDGVELPIGRFWGPERIEAGWWRGRDIQRDYYIVETGSGTRLWIFRRLQDGRWFLHGCFD